jgi:putative type II/III system pilus formation protein
MRAALIPLAAVFLAAAAPARAGAPLALAERQVVTLEFDRPVARLAVTDPDLLAIQTQGARVRVTAARGGRASLEITFDDGATVAYDVTVAAARGAPVAAAGPSEVVLAPGEERRLRAPGLARVLVEENGVARVRAEGEQVVVVGLTPGSTSLVLVDAGGTRTTWPVRVR